jgi:hypothetical protein
MQIALSVDSCCTYIGGHAGASCTQETIWTLCTHTYVHDRLINIGD